jgi:hypothetical protein
METKKGGVLMPDDINEKTSNSVHCRGAIVSGFVTNAGGFGP